MISNVFYFFRPELLKGQLQQVEKDISSKRDESSPDHQGLSELEVRLKLIREKIEDAKNEEEVKELSTAVKSTVMYACDQCMRAIEGMGWNVVLRIGLWLRDFSANKHRLLTFINLLTPNETIKHIYKPFS